MSCQDSKEAFDPGPAISEKHKLARSSLPTKPAPVSLEGRFVTLEPFRLRSEFSKGEVCDTDRLWKIFNGEPALGHPAYDSIALIWSYLPLKHTTIQTFEKHIETLGSSSEARVFTVRLKESGELVGTISLLANRPLHLAVEIGFVAISPAYQGTPVQTESTYLLLQHCFNLGYRRVEWKCNVLNARSRAAALRNGFTFEGVFRNHMIVHDEFSRDSAWFSITDDEWNEKQNSLQNWLNSEAPLQLFERRKNAIRQMYTSSS
eukprot:TRINITY_DN12540_c0_g1_i3.p1 TRINITY_DN12540_c0_g1~~TRINITY_DN12540_c0_g1_i3.p1  ORF type:complete len:279 (-),score=21.90 TRINITY_DN12540_c0_g1_i3:182-967(-)